MQPTQSPSSWHKLQPADNPFVVQQNLRDPVTSELPCLQDPESHSLPDVHDPVDLEMTSSVNSAAKVINRNIAIM